MKCALCAVGAVLLTAWVPSLLAQAQPSPPKGLQVLSATLDIPTHQVTVQLHNASDKTIVAYVLETQGFDAQGNKIGEFRREFDYAGPEPNPGKVYFIPSGWNATALTSIAWPLSLCSSRPFSASQSLTRWSSPAVASVCPSGE